MCFNNDAPEPAPAPQAPQTLDQEGPAKPKGISKIDRSQGTRKYRSSNMKNKAGLGSNSAKGGGLKIR